MNLQTVHRKPLFIALGILIVGIVAFLITNPILSEHFKTVYPKLEVNFPKNFSTEKVLSFTGSVIAECNCELNLTINEEEIALNEDGSFEYTLPVTETENEKKVSIHAQTRGVFWDNSKQTNIRTETIRRASTPIDLEAPSESSSDNNVIVVNTVPDTEVTITGYYHRDIENKEKSPEVSAVTGKADASGKAELAVPFESSAYTTKATYRIKATAPQYQLREQVFTIANSNYNEDAVVKEQERQRIAQEEAAKREAEAKEAARKKTIADEMGKYEGSGFIQIAIATNGIQKSRSIGYYSVSDPNKHQFIKVPIVVRNIGYTSDHVNPLYFTIVDSNGRTYNTDSSTYALGGYLEATTLQADTRTDGWLAFIVPKSEQELTLVYSDGFGEVIRKQIIVW